MLKELLIICLTILSSGVKSWADASYRSNDSLTNFNQGTESDSQSISISLSLPTGLPTATFDTSTASKSSSPQQLSEIRLSSCQRCIYAARNISQSDDSTTNTNAIHTKTALQGRRKTINNPSQYNTETNTNSNSIRSRHLLHRPTTPGKISSTDVFLYGYRNTWYHDNEHMTTYEITNIDGTIEYYVGQLCHSSGAGPACAMHLPPGEYLWHVGVADYANSDQVAWDFCGQHGTANAYMMFTILSNGDYVVNTNTNTESETETIDVQSSSLSSLSSSTDMIDGTITTTMSTISSNTNNVENTNADVDVAVDVDETSSPTTSPTAQTTTSTTTSTTTQSSLIPSYSDTNTPSSSSSSSSSSQNEMIQDKNVFASLTNALATSTGITSSCIHVLSFDASARKLHSATKKELMGNHFGSLKITYGISMIVETYGITSDVIHNAFLRIESRISGVVQSGFLPAVLSRSASEFSGVTIDSSSIEFSDPIVISMTMAIEKDNNAAQTKSTSTTGSSTIDTTVSTTMMESVRSVPLDSTSEDIITSTTQAVAVTPAYDTTTATTGTGMVTTTDTMTSSSSCNRCILSDKSGQIKSDASVNNNRKRHLLNMEIETTSDSSLFDTKDFFLYGYHNSWFESDSHSTVYEITDIDDTIQYYVGQLCPAITGGLDCDIELSAGKQYMWKVLYEGDPHSDMISWEFCGREGGANDVLVFEVSNEGKCRASSNELQQRGYESAIKHHHQETGSSSSSSSLLPTTPPTMTPSLQPSVTPSLIAIEFQQCMFSSRNITMLDDNSNFIGVGSSGSGGGKSLMKKSIIGRSKKSLAQGYDYNSDGQGQAQGGGDNSRRNLMNSEEYDVNDMFLYGYHNTWFYANDHSVTYEITNSDNTIQYYMGQLCSNPHLSGPQCSIFLPPGEYLWHVSGAGSTHQDSIQWEYCGSEGGADESMFFTILDSGACVVGRVAVATVSSTSSSVSPSDVDVGNSVSSVTTSSSSSSSSSDIQQQSSDELTLTTASTTTATAAAIDDTSPAPTIEPTVTPTIEPSVSPTIEPTTATPTSSPSASPSSTDIPTNKPTSVPTSTAAPTPSYMPSQTPTNPTTIPTLAPSYIPYVESSDACFSNVPSTYTSQLYVNGVRGNTFSLQTPVSIAVEFEWHHPRTEWCTSCIIQLYLGISGFATETCADAYGDDAQKFSLSHSMNVPGPGCYQIFLTEQFGYYCTFYSFGPVQSGVTIGAIWVEAGVAQDISIDTDVNTISESLTVSSELTQTQESDSNSNSNDNNHVSNDFKEILAVAQATTATETMVNFTVAIVLENVSVMRFFADSLSFVSVAEALSSATNIPSDSITIIALDANSRRLEHENYNENEAEDNTDNQQYYRGLTNLNPSSLKVTFSIFIFAEDFGETATTAMSAFNTVSDLITGAIDSGVFVSALTHSSSLFSGVTISSTVVISTPTVHYMVTATDSTSVSSQQKSSELSIEPSSISCQRCIYSAKNLTNELDFSASLFLYGYHNTWAENNYNTLYDITSTDYDQQYYSGQLCSADSSTEDTASTGPVCAIKLSPKEYRWRVSGENSVHRDKISWEFCGRNGGAGESMIFTITESGECVAEGGTGGESIMGEKISSFESIIESKFGSLDVEEESEEAIDEYFSTHTYSIFLYAIITGVIVGPIVLIILRNRNTKVQHNIDLKPFGDTSSSSKWGNHEGGLGIRMEGASSRSIPDMVRTVRIHQACELAREIPTKMDLI
eukprot:gene6364-12866_t